MVQRHKRITDLVHFGYIPVYAATIEHLPSKSLYFDVEPLKIVRHAWCALKGNMGTLPVYYTEPGSHEYAFRASALSAYRVRRIRRSARLNLAILAAVLPWIEARSDLLAFMYTCKTLYHAGSPLLLGHPLVLAHRNLAPFRSLLVTGGSERCLAIRDLDIRLDIPPDELFGPHVALLALVLRQARRLRRLRLAFELADLVPAVMNAVCSLTTLTTLELLYNGDTRDLHFAGVKKMLASLHGSLAVFRVDSTAGEACTPEWPIPHWQDLLPSLARFSDVLEQVCLPHATSLLAHDVCYPRLTHLNVRLSHLPRLSTLAACFPQLQVLELSSPGFEASGAAFLMARAANMRFQQECGPLKWHLTTLGGDATALCALALQCDAPTVRVSRVDAGLRGSWPLLGTTLKDLSPTDVSISGFSQIPVEGLSELLGGLRWLTRLEITTAATHAGIYTRLVSVPVS